MSETRKNSPWRIIITIIALTAAVAALGGLVSSGSQNPWYAALDKAPYNPPDRAFAIVWPILYTLMALGAIIVRLKAKSFAAASAAFGIFFTQLAVNLSWSWIFFGFQAPLIAFIIIAILLVLIVLMIRAFNRHSIIAGILQVPYLAWACFAAYLNGFIVYAN
ncbi:tryptophan-rich sensory protein [Henriciella barbarensis]|uniref:Tryptophan-rich sensory protein n=1 Tax=Henriciella barbarensis TaxID=86342 RepID=A0A399R8G1_9PROT|nr:TspO/MBR family protein [Henriciella barbarensis]RIJ25789.1 tryptophan-rich sensory protein [Henriciella barbarensis]